MEFPLRYLIVIIKSITHFIVQSSCKVLRNNDLDALKLVHADDVGTLDLTLGQRRLFMHALNLLNGKDQDQKPVEKHPSEGTPVTTKSLANDGGLEDLLKKIGESPWMTHF